MAWMELIRLRAIQGQIEAANGLLLGLLKDMAAEKDLRSVRLYQSIGLRTDLAMSLLWSGDAPARKGTRAGLSIIELLKPFGLVEHSVWLEQASSPNSVDKPADLH
jgi:hypothetical protein